ncbi:DUF4235 domain-containing protein [Lapillicoccus sp.]|uniref:DUF4235 domain-containing protein n=1 Tax=Lapillicoccus sp. TaxID=1909287 RepID=UPI003263BA13
MGSIGWKLMATGAALAAGTVATKLVEVGWRAISGRDAPNDPTQVEDSSWKEALLFAAIMGLAVGAARVAAERKATEYYIKSTGHAPGEASATD